MKQPIELRRLRDFGQIVNDSFTFLKENFKPLFKALLIICGFFILIGAVSTVFTYMNILSPFTMDFNRYNASVQPLAYLAGALISAFILILTQVFIHFVTFCYISVYIQKNNNTPTLAEVWGYFRYYFFRILGSGIVIFLLVVAGFFLCLIPGIYLVPVTSLIIPIIVIENTSFGYAFNKSFRLIKGNWWLVFGVLFIMSLIVGVASSAVSIPLSIIAVSGKFLSLKSFTLPLLIIFSFLRNVFMLAYVLPAIAICLCYFNLAEQKDATGLLGRIEKLGENNNDQSTLPSEEY
jgi:hypothetical protein